MLLYIIRHGEPDYATDSLTERGILQAEAVGKRIAAAKCLTYSDVSHLYAHGPDTDYGYTVSIPSK